MFYYYELKWFNDPIHVSEDLSFMERVVVFLKPLKVVKISVGNYTVFVYTASTHKDE